MGDVGGVGHETDAESVAGDGTLIALAKRHRTLLGTIIALLGAGLPLALVAGRLATNTVAATATAAAPLYVEGTDVKLSTDLAGTLRTTAGGGGGGNPTGGRLDSIRRLDTLKYLATGRLDSIRQLDTLRSLAAVFQSNPISAGLIEQPSSRATSALGTREILENWTGVYTQVLGNLPGVAAANSFVCLFNLAGSNDTLVLLSVSVGQYSVAISIAKNNIYLKRITACTGGSSIGATKYVSAYPAHTAETRITNPTVTAVGDVYVWPPNQSITAAGTTASSVDTWLPRERFILVPGEGVVLRTTTAGDVDQTYTIIIVWAERQH